MSDVEMKNVIGGSGGMGDSGVCLVGDNYGTNSADRAEERAGSSGWWCCNCSEAIKVCGGKM